MWGALCTFWKQLLENRKAVQTDVCEPQQQTQPTPLGPRPRGQASHGRLLSSPKGPFTQDAPLGGGAEV